MLRNLVNIPYKLLALLFEINWCHVNNALLMSFTWWGTLCTWDIESNILLSYCLLSTSLREYQVVFVLVASRDGKNLLIIVTNKIYFINNIWANAREIDVLAKIGHVNFIEIFLIPKGTRYWCLYGHNTCSCTKTIFL